MMNLEQATIGARTPTEQLSWNSSECLLYSLSIGAGEAELGFVTENSGIPQTVYPTFAATRTADLTTLWEAAGVTDRSTMVHGAERAELHRPLQPDGVVDISATLVAVQDRGKHAVLVVAHEATDPDSGDAVFTCTQTLVLRGQGGFGGERGVDSTTPLPDDREPDEVVTVPTRVDQALLYRLNGDRNPLHSNPEVARRVGFDRPILHGLCTYGIAARIALHHRLEGDPARFGAFTARFSRPVLPGDVLSIGLWDLSSDTTGVKVWSGDQVVLDDGLLEHRAAAS